MKLYTFIFLSLFPILLNAQQAIIPGTDGNGKYFFQVGNVYFQVNSKHGARIDSYTINDEQFLSLDTHVADMYGSTAWLSPQSLWGWPPQDQIDKNAYTGGISGDKVILTSAQATADGGNLKFVMRKTFSADLSDSSVSITYTIINKSSVAKSFAVWEIMRVPASGLSFFPLSGSITGDLNSFFLIQDGIAWWDYKTSETYKNKAFADGKSGWLAHINETRIIHIKKFPDSPSNFPSNKEMEIEFYAEPSRYYTEVEKHTDYKSIPVNDSASMQMKWYLRELPENIEVQEGNANIINYVNSIVNPINTSISTKHILGQTFNLYPNPSNGEVKIISLGKVGIVNFEVLNVLGSVVYSKKVISDEILDLHKLEKGVYFYRAYISDVKYTGKLILTK